MAQNDRRGGSTGQARPMSGNEEMSLADRLKFILHQLTVRRDEIEAVLPPDLPFERFHATVNQALRNNPDIFKGTTISIINACVKAAYDGCRLDGREAALVLHSVKVSKNPDRWEDQAQYFPMVFGIVQQVLRGGEVISLDVDVIHENDKYQVSRGTNPEIIHYPELVQPRGNIIAAYSVATLKNGASVACVMTKIEIDDVRKEAKTDYVWKRWPGEMAKKSVVRRHRKMLPLGDRDIIDVEANDMFPQFAGNQSSPAAIPDRPTRGGAAIEHQPGSEGAPLDFGNQSIERDGELIDVKTAAADGVKKTAIEGDTLTSDEGNAQAVLPEDERAWASWSSWLEASITNAAGVDAVRALEASEKVRIDAASEERRDFIKSHITDRLADLASDAAAAEATGSED